MRVAHLADLHLKLSGPRAEECRRVLDWLGDDVREQEADAIVIAGDVFDRRSTPEERLYLAGWLEGVASDVSPVHLIPGNHDDPEDVQLFSRLAGVHVFPAPECWHLQYHDCVLGCLPWPRTAHLAAALPAGVGIAERREAARGALVDVLRGFRIHMRPGRPSLLVAHANVCGAAMDSGQPVCGGEEIALTADELLECGAAGVALGHIHARQQMRAPKPCWYAGAPFRNTFGEASGGKGYLLWTWTGDGWAVEERDGPARRMVLVECQWTGGDDAHLDGDEVDPEECQDAEIRVRVEFPSDDREAARPAAAVVKKTLEDAGAHSVVVEERPIVAQRTRCAEIQAARGTAEKIAAWAQATGQEVPEGATEKLATLETEVAP